MIVRIRYSPAGAGARFMHPMDPAPRTVILAPGFRPTKAARVFPDGWSAKAARFHPTSIAGTVEQLATANQTALRLEHAVVVFTYDVECGLSTHDRELFWRSFGVPVFEQFLGPKNELLATECDAHSGLHVMRACPNQSLDSEKCGCGNPAPRLARGARIDELVELLA